MLKKCAAEGWIDGATAVAAWVVGNTVLVANVGDARAVLARRPQPAAAAVSPAAEGSGGAAASAGGGAGRAAPAQAAQQQQGSDQARAGPAPGQQPTARPAAGAADGAQQLEQLKGVTLTREHKAIFPQERQRIERAGGFVSADGRLGGASQRSAAQQGGSGRALMAELAAGAVNNIDIVLFAATVLCLCSHPLSSPTKTYTSLPPLFYMPPRTQPPPNHTQGEWRCPVRLAIGPLKSRACRHCLTSRRSP